MLLINKVTSFINDVTFVYHDDFINKVTICFCIRCHLFTMTNVFELSDDL